MTVCVLIPSYRRPDRLVACLNGVLAGTRRPDEIVVVLRDIDEDSREAFARWRADHADALRRVLLKQATATVPGQIAAMNTGLEQAQSDVVCFIDDDCVPWRNWLARLMGYYKDTRVGGVGGRDVVHEAHEQGDVLFGRVYEVGRITWCGRVIGNHHLDYMGGACEVDHLKGANMSFRRALMKPFDMGMSGGSSCLNDTDASLHVRSQGYTLIYDPAVVVDHYPAQRFDSSTRVKTDARLVYSDSHNWVYCLLRYMSPPRQVAFLAYALLVGGGTRLGLAKWLARLPRDPLGATAQFWASTRGKLAGLSRYLFARPIKER